MVQEAEEMSDSGNVRKGVERRAIYYPQETTVPARRGGRLPHSLPKARPEAGVWRTIKTNPAWA
jgi:hypothetical protein